MKTINELLRLILKELKQRKLTTGLCLLLRELYDDDVIIRDEYNLIDDYIDENHPEGMAVGYWYEWGHKKPRIKWLKEHIELTNN